MQFNTNITQIFSKLNCPKTQTKLHEPWDLFDHSNYFRKCKLAIKLKNP